MKRFLIILALSLGLGSPALHGQGGEPSISSLNERIAQAEAEIKRNEQLLGKIKGERAVTLNELKLISSRISNRLSIVSSLGQQIEICERNIKKKNAEITDLELRIRNLKGEYADMIYAAYKNHLLNNSMAFIFASKDFQEMTLRVNYMKRYNRLREAKAAELDSLSEVLRQDVRVLDAQRADLEAARKNRDAELRTLRSDEQTYKKNSTRLAANERKIAGKIKEQEKEKQKAQKQLQRLVAEEARRREGAKRSAAEERAIAVLSDSFEQNEGKFPYPVSGGVIIDRFGKHPHPTQKGLTIDNKGVNIAAERGAPVRCIFEGTVSRVVFIKGLNNCVMVNHGNYYTVYSNLAQVNVKANDPVGRNEVIGKLSSNDNSDDWYIHFELWRGTTFLNPENWLSR